MLGFQIQSLFQDGFELASAQERGADALSLAATLTAFAMLIAAPAQHRLVHAGEATRQLIEFNTSGAWRRLSDDNALATVATGGVLVVLIGTWYVLPLATRQRQAS